MILDGFILAMVGRHLVEPGVNEASRNWHAFVFWTCLDPGCTHRNGVLPHKFVTFTYFWSYFLWIFDVCGESRYGFVILFVLVLSAEGGFTARQGHQKEIDQVPLVARALGPLGLNIEGYPLVN